MLGVRSAEEPEPETRNDLSLARNDSYAAITGSMLPVCPFDSTQEMISDSLSASIPGAPVENTRPHSPSGHFDLPDQSVRRTSP